MKFFTLFLLGLFVACAGLQAQGNNEDAKLVEAGNFALNFQINGFGDFGLAGDFAGSTTLTPMFLGNDSVLQELFGGINFPVYGVGFKTFVSDNFALRASLGINYSSQTDRMVDPTDPTKTIEQTDDMFVAAIAPGVEYHFLSAGPVSGYTGAMLSYTSGVKTTGPDSAQRSSISSTLFFGGILGAEFFPWDNFSLGAEYFLGFNSTSTSTDVGDVTTDGPSYFNLGTGNFAVRASLYIK